MTVTKITTNDTGRRNMELKIEYVPIEDIRPYANNAKTHPAEQIEQIKKSIEQFGFNDPIAIWHGEVVEGHGRLIAATEMGIDTVPIIRLDNLTDEQRRAYGLVHNKLTMNSGFNFDLLQMELESLSFDMSEFDFEIDEDEGWTPVNGHNQNTPPPTPHIEPAFTPNGVVNGEAGGVDPYLPEQYDDSEIQQYTDRQEEFTVKKRVIITYLPEQEQALAERLRLQEIDKVLYDFDDLG